MSTPKAPVIISKEGTGGKPLPTASEILDRLKEKAGIATDTELAAFLQTTKTNISKSRSRNSVAHGQIIAACLAYGFDLKYVLTGVQTEERVFLPGQIDSGILGATLMMLVKDGELKLSKKTDFSALANLIASNYHDIHMIAERLSSSLGIKAASSRQTAILMAMTLTPGVKLADVLSEL